MNGAVLATWIFKNDWIVKNESMAKKKWMAKASGAVCMALLMANTAYAAKKPERLLLTTQEWYPYQYSVDGVMKGRGIEKIKCIMRKMEQPYQLTMTQWDNAQLLVEVGTQNGFFLASRNDVRDKYAVLSDPVLEQKWSWFSLSDAIDLNQSMFKQQVEVAALFGSNKWFWLQNQGYLVNKKPRSVKAMLELLISGDVGAILGNDEVIEQTIKKMGLSYRAIAKTTVKRKPLGVYFSREFTKKYPQFLSTFNLAIKKCKSI